MPERNLISRLQQLGKPRIAVLGDLMLDRYVWGDASRVSPEAPVPVVHASREDHRLGGAGNVAANVCGLGAEALCFGVVGDDAAGREVADGLRALGAQAEGLLIDAQRPTIQKIRIMARNQQMLRVDREDARALDPQQQQLLCERLCAAKWDALILSDYGKGILSDEILRRVLAEAQRRGVPSLVDPKHRDLTRYRGATVVTPNRAEAETAAGRALPDLASLAAAGEELRARSQLDALLITLGEEGIYLLRQGEKGLHLPTAARQVYDVTGAGDTVIASLAVGLAAGMDWTDSVRLANAAAGLAVSKVGTTVVGRQELLHHLRAEVLGGKFVAAGEGEELAGALAALTAEGRRVVFTNGCFDILHAGHVRYLREARRLGDALVVGLNDDASVRRLKGPERPINPLHDRVEVLAALECVDLVIAFAEDTPQSLIEQVCPQVLAKGADYAAKGVVGAEFVRSRGGEVQLIDLVPGRSTSAIVERIRDA